ncbi:MAG: arginyltransferase [Alphaproteobacteria bacterium]|nr:arginyltransferase [Alphaproteobacteria bacterium]
MTRFPIDLSQPFYRTFPLPCPYIEGRMEQRVFTVLTGSDSGMLFDLLSRAGFRRSLDTVYQPSCPECEACVPVRILAAEFTPGRTFRRVLRDNRDLRAELLPARATREQYQLFSRYLKSRHGDGEMAAMSWEDYLSFAEDTPAETFIAEFRLPATDGDSPEKTEEGGELLAACIVDRLGDGLSAVYSFFDPQEESRGLGNFMLLWLVDKAAKMGLSHVYPGYWIADCQKMSYKTRFQPLERLAKGGWKPFAEEEAPEETAPEETPGEPPE